MNGCLGIPPHYDVDMLDSGKARRTRLDLINPPQAVFDDPAVGREWQRMTRRIMLRWALLVVGAMMPWVIVLVLTVREHLIAEPAAIIIMSAWGALAAGMALVIRRWAHRQLDEFAERELSEQV